VEPGVGVTVMRGTDAAAFRLRLAVGFLGEAQQDMDLARWRSCVDNSQLATENAAKAVLALLGPVGRTHDVASLLQLALSSGRFADSVTPAVERLAECAGLLGPDLHARSDYGDEGQCRTPWELFGEDDARMAASLPEEAVGLASSIVRGAVRAT